MNSSDITQASNFVKGVDSAFILILGISFFFLIGLTVVMLYFIYKYNRKRNPKATQSEGSVSLEILWTVIPFIITMVMFYVGWAGYKPMRNAPKNSMEVTVYGRMWNFSFEYGNGRRTDTLYLPMNKPVKLNLKALDVIHSIYIPAFRVKQDMVPGKKNNMMWFEPQREGYYELFCAEYCGLQHSYMNTSVVVMPESSFDSWYADTTKVATSQAVESPAASGRRILQNIGCLACHTLNGSKLVGPSFKGLYGNSVKVKTGNQEREIVADDAYIKSSIYDPNTDVVDGFNKGLMLSYQGQLSDSDISKIIEYLKTVK